MTLDRDAFLRYSRHLLLADVGEAGQERLSGSRVLIVGLGGLGCPVALYLAAAGVGRLGLCDPDRVDLTNLQRQVLYRTGDCGESKVDVALRELKALNPSIELAGFPCPVDDRVLPPGGDGYDLVVDCTDNLAARHWLNRRCRQLAIPLVSGAAMGWEGQLVTLDFSRQQRPCLACAMPEDSAEPVANCGNSGVIGPLLGAMGSLQAISALRLLLGTVAGEALAGSRLKRFDARRDQWSSFALQPRPGCPVCAPGAESNGEKLLHK
ncbi:MAG: HesA/MoeB/ThiF family protein [Porticoccaceae bacterium]|jgi:molybdopterin/thiamine biosynthesis adenylyltransferase|nr:HesA/MoeB/ThiF family protein [Porticoccaceae bacterium]